MQISSDNEFNVTNSKAMKMLGLSGKAVRGLPLPYRQFKPRGRRYYRLADIENLNKSSIHQP